MVLKRRMMKKNSVAEVLVIAIAVFTVPWLFLIAWFFSPR